MSADLSVDLKNLIDRYLEGHRSRSLATLARASGVAYTTLRRFSQREGNPSAEPVLKIVDATLGPKDKFEFIETHFPELARTLGPFNEQTYRDQEPVREDLKYFYARDPHNLILNLVVTDKGSSIDDVRRLCGERGVKAADEMVEAGVLTRDLKTGELRWQLGDSLLTVDCQLILSQIRRATDYFDPSLGGTKAAKLAHLTASVDDQGLEKINAILTQAIEQIVKIKDDPRYAGDIPFFASAMMNVYDKAPLVNSSKGSSHGDD